MVFVSLFELLFPLCVPCSAPNRLSFFPFLSSPLKSQPSIYPSVCLNQSFFLFCTDGMCWFALMYSLLIKFIHIFFSLFFCCFFIFSMTIKSCSIFFNLHIKYLTISPASSSELYGGYFCFFFFFFFPCALHWCVYRFAHRNENGKFSYRRAFVSVWRAWVVGALSLAVRFPCYFFLVFFVYICMSLLLCCLFKTLQRA